MTKKIAIFLSCVFTLSACLSADQTFTAPVERDDIATSINVVGFDVIVPEELTVSEANLYIPSADIVWRGQARGDRRKQVQAILSDALERGTRHLDRGREVVLTLEVVKFHALTEKARYSVGGIHTMRFNFVVWDAKNGSSIYGPVKINADLVGLGGSEALDAEAKGLTQQVRITEHVAGTVQQTLFDAGLARDNSEDPNA